MNQQFSGMFDLSGKVVFVAGGAGAIGSELARACLAFGAKVAIADLSGQASAEMAARLASAVERPAEMTMGVELNVLDPASIQSAVSSVEQHLGVVQGLINAAGTHIEQPAHELTIQAWDTVLDINLRGAFLLSQAVTQHQMANKTGGSHIHITSVRSNLGIRRGYAAYVASKGGLGILIKQLATEWAKFGIRVNGIAPTFTRTPLVADYLNDPDFYQGLVNRIPMGRVCETSDLVGLAVFLTSEASSFITGQNIFVDGGVTASQ
jgi:gluconate 5-dehydrogenase